MNFSQCCESSPLGCRGLGLEKESRNVCSFRSVINKCVAKTAFECGQSKQVRQEAADFWKKVGGERFVMAHVAQYLDKHSATNPHFAIPKPGNT
ncbi:unnamed protein product [Spodoptera exigua]|nr:unnamed protein product [Spodoptera exigua]